MARSLQGTRHAAAITGAKRTSSRQPTGWTFPPADVPAVHVQVHALGLLEAAEVGGHLGLLHGLALQVGKALDELDALVVLAANEGLLGRLQVQFLQGGLSQQTPGGFTAVGGDKATVLQVLFLAVVC